MMRTFNRLVNRAITYSAVLFLGTGAFAGYALMDHHTLDMLGAALSLWVVSAVWLGIAVALYRVGTLRDMYAAGYRHGRHDANTTLMQQGIWLSHAAEREAEGLD